MKILISNDDGVHAKGLAILVETLSLLAEVVVVAPDRDKSGASHSLTLDMPLRITRQLNGFFSVNGTPSDAVHLAIRGWLEPHPDMVISGINVGANLGDDVLYSGTVAAAMEGRFLGYPALAFSLVSKVDACQYYETAAKVAALLFAKLQNNPLPRKTILNVNVPDKPWHEIKGVKITRLGHRHLGKGVIKGKDPRGHPIYWIGPSSQGEDVGEGTDFHAISEGYVSVTPLKIDLTDHEALEKVSHWFHACQLEEMKDAPVSSAL